MSNKNIVPRALPFTACNVNVSIVISSLSFKYVSTALLYASSLRHHMVLVPFERPAATFVNGIV